MHGIAELGEGRIKYLYLYDKDTNSINTYTFGFIFGFNRDNASESPFEGLYVVELVRFTTSTKRPFPIVKVIAQLMKPYVMSIAMLKYKIIKDILPLAESMYNIVSDDVTILYRILNEKKFKVDECQDAINTLMKYAVFFDQEDLNYFIEYLKSDAVIEKESSDHSEDIENENN